MKMTPTEEIEKLAGELESDCKYYWTHAEDLADQPAMIEALRNALEELHRSEKWNSL